MKIKKQPNFFVNIVCQEKHHTTIFKKILCLVKFFHTQINIYVYKEIVKNITI